MTTTLRFPIFRRSEGGHAPLSSSTLAPAKCAGPALTTTGTRRTEGLADACARVCTL